MDCPSPAPKPPMIQIVKPYNRFFCAKCIIAILTISPMSGKCLVHSYEHSKPTYDETAYWRKMK